MKNLWKSHFVRVENDEQAENIDSSIELEKNPQAVSVDTCVTVASHLLNRMEKFAVIVFIDIKGRIDTIDTITSDWLQ